jgi:hypothetical protein
LDLNSLLRLASSGVSSYPPADLPTLADWCWDHGETTGDARYCSLWRSLSAIVDLFDAHGAVPVAVTAALDRIFQESLPDIVAAPDVEVGAGMARALRESVMRAAR